MKKNFMRPFDQYLQDYVSNRMSFHYLFPMFPADANRFYDGVYGRSSLHTDIKIARLQRLGKLADSIALFVLRNQEPFDLVLLADDSELCPEPYQVCFGAQHRGYAHIPDVTIPSDRSKGVCLYLNGPTSNGWKLVRGCVNMLAGVGGKSFHVISP